MKYGIGTEKWKKKNYSVLIKENIISLLNRIDVKKKKTFYMT